MTDGIRATTIAVPNVVVFQISGDDADELAKKFSATPPQPDPEEIDKEAVITYKRDVVGHLLHQGHDNPAVEQFVSKHLQPLQRASQKRPEQTIRFGEIPNPGSEHNSVVYGKNREATFIYDDIQAIFSNSGFLPGDKYISGMLYRFS